MYMSMLHVHVSHKQLWKQQKNHKQCPAWRDTCVLNLHRQKGRWHCRSILPESRYVYMYMHRTYTRISGVVCKGTFWVVAGATNVALGVNSSVRYQLANTGLGVCMQT